METTTSESDAAHAMLTAEERARAAERVFMGLRWYLSAELPPGVPGVELGSELGSPARKRLGEMVLGTIAILRVNVEIEDLAVAAGAVHVLLEGRERVVSDIDSQSAQRYADALRWTEEAIEGTPAPAVLFAVETMRIVISCALTESFAGLLVSTTNSIFGREGVDALILYLDGYRPPAQ
jgi:hypothetical protein